MFDLLMPVEGGDLQSLDAALRAQFGDRISGLSYIGKTLHVHFFEAFTPADEMLLQAVIDGHDPVFITAERSGEVVTVSLNKPRNVDSATELTLTIDDVAAPSATMLTDNTATVAIQSVDTITIGIFKDYPHQEVTI